MPVNPNATARLHSAPQVRDLQRTSPRQPSASKRRRRPMKVVHRQIQPSSSMINDQYNGLISFTIKMEKIKVRLAIETINEWEYH